MPELNIVDTAPGGAEGQIQTPYLAVRQAGYNYANTGGGFLEFGNGTPGALPFRVDQDGNVTAASISASGLTPSGDVTGAADAAGILAAVAALPAGGGTVSLAPGSWYLKPGTVDIELGNAQSVVIQGSPGVVINTVAGASGDVIRMRNPSPQSGGLFSIGSGLVGKIIIDGASADAGTAGLHIGDIVSVQADVIISNFDGAGDIGIWVDNSASWTEDGNITAVLSNCTQHAVIQVTDGNKSFARTHFDFTIVAGSNQQDGVVFQDGADFYQGFLTIRGNHTADGAPTSAALLKMQGAAPGGSPDAGATVIFVDNQVMIGMECGAGANPPVTIFMDQSDFAYGQGNYGVMSWAVAGSPTNFAPASMSQGQFLFSGQVNGDPTLFAQPTLGYGDWTNTNSPYFYTDTGFISGDIAPTASADFSSITLTGDLTVALGNPATAASPQRFTAVIRQAASGGPFTVTWPHAGSPSVSTPTVLWAGGVAPTMTAAANAVDVYDLETIDGATWYGRATQDVS